MRKKKRYTDKQINDIIDYAEIVDINPEIQPMWQEPFTIVCQKPNEVTVMQMIRAVKTSHGIVGFAARYLGVSISQFNKWITKHPGVKRAIAQENDHVIDIAEGKLYDSLAKGHQWAIRYVLDTKGKKRGWTTEYIADPKVGELLKSINTLVGIDDEELGEYDQEQLQYNYEK